MINDICRSLRCPLIISIYAKHQQNILSLCLQLSSGRHISWSKRQQTTFMAPCNKHSKYIFLAVFLYEALCTKHYQYYDFSRHLGGFESSSTINERQRPLPYYIHLQTLRMVRQRKTKGLSHRCLRVAKWRACVRTFVVSRLQIMLILRHIFVLIICCSSAGDKDDDDYFY